MEFLKDLLIIQQKIQLYKLSDELFTNEKDKEMFIKRFNKTNYCSIKIVSKNSTITKSIKI